MITDISFKLDDFEFNFVKLRALYNQESDTLKANFFINNRIDWIKFQEYIRNNSNHYSEFIADLSSYEIFHSNLLPNLITGKKSFNQKILSYYNSYISAMNYTEPFNRTSLYVIVHALVNNPTRYWSNPDQIISYNELDLYKRLLVLNGLGLLGRNKFGVALMTFLTIHYGIIEISTEDINACLSDLDRNNAVA